MFMMLNMYKMLVFIPVVILSSLMILFSSSWFSQWMIMEINMMSFLSLMVFENKKNVTSMNYFLVQSFMSYLFIMLMMNMGFLNDEMNFKILFLINLIMLTKMGLPPFYLWYIKVMKFLNWMNCFILMTIQKVIPLVIMLNLSSLNNSKLMNFNLVNLIFISLILSLLGLQSLNLKILMAYSSIIQMSWIMVLNYISEVIMMLYLLVYFLISLTLVLIFNKFNLIYLNSLIMLKFNNSWMYMVYLFSLMSMASIPPFFGFLMKWISIQILSGFYSFYLMLMMIINSLISMYFYLRLMFFSLLNLSFSIKMNYLMVNLVNLEGKNLIYLIWIMNMMLLIYELC